MFHFNKKNSQSGETGKIHFINSFMAELIYWFINSFSSSTAFGNNMLFSK
jgi:hypothetical protein